MNYKEKVLEIYPKAKMTGYRDNGKKFLSIYMGNKLLCGYYSVESTAWEVAWNNIQSEIIEKLSL